MLFKLRSRAIQVAVEIGHLSGTMEVPETGGFRVFWA